MQSNEEKVNLLKAEKASLKEDFDVTKAKLYVGICILIVALLGSISAALFVTSSADAKLEGVIEQRNKAEGQYHECLAFKEAQEVRLEEEFEKREVRKKGVNKLTQYISKKNYKIPSEIADLISEEITHACEKHNVPVKLVVGLIDVESAFDPMAKSNKGAHGLMQVRFEVWSKELAIENRNDLHGIRNNLDAGITILKHYLSITNGNLAKALGRYNGSSNGEYADKVYAAIGRFITFNDNTIESMGKKISKEDS